MQSGLGSNHQKVIFPNKVGLFLSPKPQIDCPLLSCGVTRQPVGKPVSWAVLGFLPRVFKTNESKVAAAGALFVWVKKHVKSASKSGASYEPAENLPTSFPLRTLPRIDRVYFLDRAEKCDSRSMRTIICVCVPSPHLIPRP